MLKITVQLLPGGHSQESQVLGTLYIENTEDHPKRPGWGLYLCHHDGGSFRVVSHVRDPGCWMLVYQCLSQYLGLENK